MTEEELLRRAEDLALRASRRGELTHSTFLTPAECALLSRRRPAADCVMLLHGGVPGAERRAAFFLPDWMDADAFDPQEHLCAIELTARFGEPCHRDYLGAALGLGVGREWLGDILIEKNVAHLICLPSVKEHLLLNLDKVGRWGVKAREVPLAAVPVPEKQLREVTFSVKSPRLDAVCAGMFGLSRSAAAEAIAQGLVTKNYVPCQKPDAPIAPGDILSLRGKGKGEVAEVGDALTRKGRVLVRAGVYV